MYKYEEIKPEIFKEKNQKAFLKIRDEAKKLLEKAGAFTLESILRVSTGDTWLAIAMVDRLVELGELIEVPQEGIMSQYRIFTKGA